MMDESVLSSVSTVAVWGSLGSSVLLGTCMLIQSVVDTVRRRRYAVFALVCLATIVVDSLHGAVDTATYEWLRTFVWSGYGPSVLLLLGASPAVSITTAAAIAATGVGIWDVAGPQYATSSVLPITFALTAYAMWRQYRSSVGFASCVLSGCYLCQALACVFYIPVVGLQNPTFTGLGYLHYAALTTSCVIFGWINLPRELRGRSPVKTPRRLGASYLAFVAACELGALPSFLIFRESQIPIFLGWNVLQISAVFFLYFVNRHDLVIYTENVTELLEDRTKSLRDAREELARKNEEQAGLLEDQAKQLKSKAEVIERQRRLELAAQTAGQAAHDIQNLIAPMQTQLTALGRAVRGGERAPTDTVLASLRRQLDDLMELNGQMLALSRRGRLDMNPLDPEQLVQDVVTRLPDNARVRIEARATAWVNGAWSQLSRAVMNLVLNALEASDGAGGSPGSEVVIRISDYENQQTRRCHLGFLGPGKYVRLEVADSGPGIPEADLERIFQPFFSSKRGTTRSGSGLGLSIVAGVVEDHQAPLELVTGPAGTSFVIYLSAAAPLERVDDQALCGNETIAVIDDDSSLSDQYEQMLSKVGYSVVTADDGVEAIQLLQVQSVDLILLDLSMPKMNGAETFFAVLHIRPGARVVIHSSFMTDAQLKEIQALGPAAVLQKPASRVELLRTIRTVLDAR